MGHPDSICDALAETLSRNLCRHYLDRFGEILHHNVDKALLCGGNAAPRFGGGEVVAPIEIYLSGRATATVGDLSVPLDEIAIEGSRAWLREHLHAFDAHRHVLLHNVLRPGSRARRAVPASARRRAELGIGERHVLRVGYAPMTALELLVLRTEMLLNGRPRTSCHPPGAGRQVMGVRRDAAVS